MEINKPAVVAEVREAFMRYERALNVNDLAVLDASFWDSPHTIRYGIGENLHGIDAIRAFRGARPTNDLARTIEDTVITTYGDDFATASTLFRRASTAGRIGRQMQTWVRMPAPQGWRVVAAHVSVVPDGAASGAGT